jgi:hypothetical protein
MLTNFMTCALCRNERELQVSHILPKFAQRRIKENARAGHGRMLAHLAGRERPVQNFAFEKLLCAECEHRFSIWEAVGADFMRRPELAPDAEMHGTPLELISLPYTPLKLFLLSVLWRMGVSSSPDFAAVELGPHEPILRGMLINGDPGPTEAYGCSLQILTDRTGRIPLTRPADRSRLDNGCRLYRLILDGSLFIWQVGQPLAVARSSTQPFLLQSDGTWRVFIQSRRGVPFVHEALRPIFRRPPT